MASHDPAVLAYHVRRLDREALRALVADLWAARGYETTVEDGVVHATDESGTVRIGVGGVPDGGVDVLVGTGRSVGQVEGVRVLEAADVAEMLRYAVGPAASRQLCERHLGAPPGALRPSPATRLRRRAATAVERTPPALVVVAAVALLALAGLAQLPGAPAGEPAANESAGTPEPTPMTPVQTTSMPVPEVTPDWKSPPVGGYEQFVCGAPDAPNASDLPSADCGGAANGSEG